MEDGGEECKPLSGQQGFPVTAVLLSRGGGSSTGREAAWDRWTSPAPTPLLPPTATYLIKNTSLPLLMCKAKCMYICTHVVCECFQTVFKVLLVQLQNHLRTRLQCSIFCVIFFSFSAYSPLSYPLAFESHLSLTLPFSLTFFFSFFSPQLLQQEVVGRSWCQWHMAFHCAKHSYKRQAHQSWLWPDEGREQSSDEWRSGLTCC